MMIQSGAVIFLTVFVSVLSTVSGQVWQSPYFVDPNTPGVDFDGFVGTSQRIRMEEELPVRIKLAIINYDGTGTPYIGDFIDFTGGAASIQMTVSKDDGQWAIFIENRQDYENPNQQSYEFVVGIRDDSTAPTNIRIVIRVINIFDNDPTIIYDGPCQAKELHANYDTECTFQVYDADGLFNNSFRMEIVGDYNETEHFELRFAGDSDEYTRTYTLFVTNEVRYVDRVLYNFKTHVYDVANNTGNVTTIVEIEDIRSEDPIWVIPFATFRFDEKTEQTKLVKAIDGDTGLNEQILYRLAFPSGDFSEYVTVDETTGLIHISEINRDALKQEVFPFNVIAYKWYNESWAITGDAVLIVDDVNDNYPEIEIIPNVIEFDENKYLTLQLENFTVNDIDLGIHATYDVSLLSRSGSLINYAEPFSVIPTRGYQESSFTISVIDTIKLDYEDLEWQDFVIIIKSQEEDFPEHTRQFELNIKLRNWNDEFPIFNSSEYTIDVLETTEANQILTAITATDRDIDDEVVHRIVGITDLLISREGIISTLENDTFDYERQTQVLVQIQATDTLQTYPGEKLNSAYAQLIIKVIDVNDETPQIRMPRQSPSIEENSIGGLIVTDGIIATDPDTTADLEFNINWELSYATKSGQAADQELYENCFIIEADKTDHNRVIGRLKVNPDFPIFIDYEKYEVLYLAIFVTDLNQEVNEGTADAVLTVRIEDLNDNAPFFILNTLDTPRSVVEEASGTLIGTIFAQDIDGPKFNVFKYSIKPSSELTPDDLVEINEDNGVITVKDGAVIDCDGDPKIYDLVYTVTLNDSLWITEGEIRISIIDINNKIPFFNEFAVVVSLYENATTGDEIQMISTSDMDRDVPHNIIHYMINFPDFPTLGRYFGIDELSGQLSVRLQGDAVLDRDHDEDTHDIHIKIEDNYQGNGRTNGASIMVRLILLDVNDNAPVMPELEPTISENAQIGERVVSGFFAPDIDDDTTPNAQVEYRILSVEAGGDNAEQTPDASEIFEIRNYDLKYCDIVVKQSLKGYYGTWLVTIEAYDHGDNWTTQLQLKSEKTYRFVVNPFNYMAPELVYPLSDKKHRLSYDNQQVGKPLILSDNTVVPMFEARDDDGGDFGDIRFEITSDGEDDDASYFDIVKETRNKSQIYLRKPIAARSYKLDVRASDGGSRTSERALGVLFIFIDLTGEPFFDIQTFSTDFTENVTGLGERRIIPEAIDPKNIGSDNEDDKFIIYYFIDTQYRPSDAQLFQLDSVTRTLQLAAELDREEIDNHQIRIIATNNRTGPHNAKENSMLLTMISVNDVNDNPPKFEFKVYGAGITPTDRLGKEILTVTANDPDLDDVVRYEIDADGIKSSGDDLTSVVKTAFVLERDTGVLKLNFEVLATMKGYFEFKIIAYDLENHQDVCDVKIFIIADSARVTFVLMNEIASVEHSRGYVAQTLSHFYEYECNIDDIQPHVLNGQQQNGLTNVRVHFINNSEAIEANVILSRSGDIAFITNLKTALLQESINLFDVPNGGLPETVANMEWIIRIILIVLAVLLAALSCSLSIAYCIKTRSLNRQLKALSATDFGSTESNLNRREAPTTNVFSVEGSNPVLNNNDMDKGIFDNMSVISESSDDSDFVGLDNDPTFKRESTNVAVVNGMNGKLGNVNLQDDFDNYMNESKKNSRNSDFGFSKF